MLLLAGCASPGYKERRDASRELQERLLEESAQIVEAHGGRLGFEDVLELARSRGLKLTQQNLEATLARITRDTAFSAFLPQIEATYARTDLHTKHGPLGVPPYMVELDGLKADAFGVTLVQPVFTPAAWLMFVEAQYARRLKEIAAERAAELLDMQVALLYDQAVVAERVASITQARVGADEELVARVERLRREGFALPADVARAHAKLAADKLQLQEARDAVTLSKARLCEVMRLWPQSDFQVDGASLAEAAEWPWRLLDDEGQPVEHSAAEAEALSLQVLVWQGLINRKELYAGDQAVVLRRTQVLEALAAFLPNLFVGGGVRRLSVDDLALRYWNTSLAATWAAFEGFRSVNAYRAATAQREAEAQLQEDRMLAVVTAVIEAWQGARVAGERFEAAQLAAQAAEMDYADAERRRAEGQETMAVVLDKLAVRDAAQVALERARYASALATLALRQAVGVGFAHGEAAAEDVDKQ